MLYGWQCLQFYNEKLSAKTKTGKVYIKITKNEITNPKDFGWEGDGDCVEIRPLNCSMW